MAKKTIPAEPPVEETAEAVNAEIDTAQTAPAETAEADAEQVQQELERLQQELEEQKDRLLRTAAEFDNYKKRTTREMERIGADSRARVVKDLLPVLDNFERAQQSGDASAEDYRKGVDMSIKQFVDLLARLGLEEIEAEGAAFDPNVHYAVSRVEDDAAPENTVVQVLQKGYRMGDTVLRPAMVAVANC